MDNRVFDQNKKVYTSLAGYNVAYTNYLSCLDNSGADCSTLGTQLDSSYNELSNNITQLYSLLSNRPFDDTNVKEMYEKNNKLRYDLASQLQELYKNKVYNRDELNINNGLASFRNSDSSIYLGLVWTTVATGCLYYIFVKL